MQGLQLPEEILWVLRKECPMHKQVQMRKLQEWHWLRKPQEGHGDARKRSVLDLELQRVQAGTPGDPDYKPR